MSERQDGTYHLPTASTWPVLHRHGPMHLASVAVVAALVTLSALPASAAVEACPQRSVVTSDCSLTCPEAAVCIHYSSSASSGNGPATVSADLKADSSGCIVRCLASSLDPQHKILSVRIPAEGPAIEEIAALALPANVTGLNVTVEALGPQTVAFPGRNIVANGTLLNFLGLHNISPETLPDPVYDLPLATLRIQLSSPDFPAVMSRFKTISTLILDGSALTAFPYAEVIGDMPQVRVLSLKTNAITKIPVDDTTDPLYVASALHELSLAENQLTEFGARFSSLRVLDLRSNKLTTLPTSLDAMPVLEELRLDGNTIDQTQLSVQLAGFQPQSELKTLGLSSCGLTATLPDGFNRVFASLTHLQLAQNGLTSVAAGSLPEDSLVSLNVSGNKISSFTGSFRALRSLDVSHNALDTLPTSLPETLISLNASSNGIVSSNVSGAVNLEMLDLSANKLTAFPETLVWDAARLTVLRLHSNPDMAPINLTSDQFEKLNNLQELSVDESLFGAKGCPSDRLITSKHGVSACVVQLPKGEHSKSTNETAKASTSRERDSRLAGMITTIVLVVGGIIFGISAYIHSKKRKRQQLMLALNNHDHESDTAPFGEMPPTFKHAPDFEATTRTKASSTASATSSAVIWNDDKLLHLRVDMESIRFFKVVGMGAYGQVWRGTCRISSTESSHVAIKTLSPDLARDRHVVKRFVAQTILQATLSHPRVVTVIGVAWSSPTNLCVLMEFMPRGDLFATLHYSSSSSCSSTSTLFQRGVWGESKLQIALDIIDALSFAHAQSPIVLHRDLKSRNVLLDTHGRAKVSDFGVVLSPHDETNVTSPLWTAPEVLYGTSGYDEKTDVFSFGVILSELDTHEIPYGFGGSATTMLTSVSKKKKRRGTEEEADKVKLLLQIASGEISPNFLSSCPPAIYDIAQKCLAVDPAIRPTALEVNFLLRRVEREGSDARMSSVHTIL